MNRHQARETLLSLVFEMDFKRGGDCIGDYGDFFDMATADREIETNDYMRSAFIGICEHLDEIDGKIAEVAIGWTPDRMSRMSISIMRLAVYEMLWVDDVPFSAAINEAVELAKQYDHDSAPAFINGILNKIAEKDGLK